MEWLKRQLSPDDFSVVMQQMKRINWKRVHKQIKKISVGKQITGWDRLPAITDFKIVLGPLHPMLRLIGIDKRTPNSLEFESMDTSEANRFITWSMYRLSKLRHDPHKFFKLAWILIKTSSAFRASAINHVIHNWYKDHSWFFVLNTNRKVNKLIREMRADLEFKRVYIPKEGGKWRPLGVPTPEWRVLLHMVNNFIHWYSLPHILPSQHGFIPGRGTLTAWKDLIGSGKLDSAFIYECDLKNFFNEVSLKTLNRRLGEIGLPRWVSDWIFDLNMSIPRLPANQELDETPTEIKSETYHQNELGGLTWFLQREFLGIEPGEYGSPKAYFGMPQGSPTSPFLSMLLLNKFLSQRLSISYADDPIFFGSKDFTIRDFPEDGIIISEEKSGWVKREGKWLKPLKFLGIEYDGRTLRAKTRSGADLVCEGTHKEMLVAISEWEKLEGLFDSSTSPELSNSKFRVLNSWKKIFSSKLAGFLQSAMYNNTWNLQVEQDFALKFGSSSWINLQSGHHPEWSTFTVSSYATASLIQTIRNGSCIRRVRTGISKVKIRYTAGNPARSRPKRSQHV